MDSLTISVITVSFNSKLTISDTIKSVITQSHSGIEYILIDGGSSDGTMEIVELYGNKISKVISESDQGIYDAINKGIRVSTGDIIGILNSDDYLTDSNVIQRIADAFEDNDIDAVYGDVQFIDTLKPGRISRYYSSKKFDINKFKYGYMPAHPSLYARRDLFEKYGYYKTDYRIAADYELLIRFMYGHRIKCHYIEMPFVNMRPGGVSNKSFYSRYLLNKEILRACRENGIRTNYLNIYSKYFRKSLEYIGNNP